MKKNANLLNLGDKNSYALFAKIPYGGAYAGFEEFGQFGDDSTWAFWLNWTGDNSSCIFWLRFDIADIRKGDKKICLREFNTWAGADPLVYYKDNVDESCIELYARNVAMRPGTVQLLSQSYNRNIVMIDRLVKTVKDGELSPALVLNAPTLTGLKIKSFACDTRKMSPKGIENFDVDVTISGCTPIAIAGVDTGSQYVAIGNYSTQASHAYLAITNVSDKYISVAPKIIVIYTQNPVW